MYSFPHNCWWYWQVWDLFILRLQWVSPQPMVLYVLSIAMIQGIDMKIIWGCKNDANPPAVLKLWVLEVGGWADKEVVDWHKSQAFPQKIFLYKHNNFWSMQSSPYGLFILVDYPPASNLVVREIYYYIYLNSYILRKIGGWVFCCFFITHVVVKKTGFKNGQPKISPLINAGPLYFQ